MSSEKERASQYRNEAQSDRASAKRKWAEGDLAAAQQLFEDAVAKHQQAIRLLRRALRASRRAPKGNEREELALLRLLSQTQGALGGTWRDASRLYNRTEEDADKVNQALQEAIKAYDEGYHIEKERKQLYQDDDSYNLLQRLVVRLLCDSRALNDTNLEIGNNLNVPEKLKEACKEIERQVVIEKTRNDSWAKADLVLVRALLGQNVEDAVKDLDEDDAEKSFYRSTHTVIESLLDEELGRKDNLKNQLQTFKQSLELKGGFSS
jgi:hypothetical protein